MLEQLIYSQRYSNLLAGLFKLSHNMDITLGYIDLLANEKYI